MSYVLMLVSSTITFIHFGVKVVEKKLHYACIFLKVEPADILYRRFALVPLLLFLLFDLRDILWIVYKESADFLLRS
ncbi:hypothetical protein LI82_12715 [Methanococcoides methylutens]|uniref:Uncharacterized protein n=1 Tax=Methanococcoides methylutens TaxID=2226 RepID=A0A099T0C8_METMT|nr:hypothetical protein LI82_12715 [Methanococcoides methylutens]